MRNLCLLLGFFGCGLFQACLSESDSLSGQTAWGQVRAPRLMRLQRGAYLQSLNARAGSFRDNRWLEAGQCLQTLPFVANDDTGSPQVLAVPTKQGAEIPQPVLVDAQVLDEVADESLCQSTGWRVRPKTAVFWDCPAYQPPQGLRLQDRRAATHPGGTFWGPWQAYNFIVDDSGPHWSSAYCLQPGTTRSVDLLDQYPLSSECTDPDLGIVFEQLVPEGSATVSDKKLLDAAEYLMRYCRGRNDAAQRFRWETIASTARYNAPPTAALDVAGKISFVYSEDTSPPKQLQWVLKTGAEPVARSGLNDYPKFYHARNEELLYHFASENLGLDVLSASRALSGPDPQPEGIAGVSEYIRLRGSITRIMHDIRAAKLSEDAWLEKMLGSKRVWQGLLYDLLLEDWDSKPRNYVTDAAEEFFFKVDYGGVNPFSTSYGTNLRRHSELLLDDEFYKKTSELLQDRSQLFADLRSLFAKVVIPSLERYAAYPSKNPIPSDFSARATLQRWLESSQYTPEYRLHPALTETLSCLVLKRLEFLAQQRSLPVERDLESFNIACVNEVQ